MTAPQRVLFLTKGLGPGGAERLLVEQASGGDRDRFEYHVAYLLPWKQHLVPELEALGVTTHCLDVRSEGDPRWLGRLARLVLAHRFHVIHAHSPLSASLARPLDRCFRDRPAFVYTEHNRWASFHAATRAANMATYSLNDKVIAVSKDVRDSVHLRYQPRVEVIQHGVDLEAIRAKGAERDAIRRELGVADHEVLVVTVANLRAGKNYPSLLDAAKQLVDRDLPVRFAAVGQGQLEDEIRQLHGELGLGDRFQLLGYRADAVRVIAGADVFALASLHEGLPVAVMEALALGVPVVAPAVGGLPEVIDSGVNGVLVAPGDSTALAEALRDLLDPDVRAKLAAGAKTSGDGFSSRGAVARVEDIYREVTAGRAGC